MGLRSRLKDTLGALLGGTQDTERRPQPYRSPVASIIDDARAQERAQAEERARAEEATRAQRLTPASPAAAPGTHYQPVWAGTGGGGRACASVRAGLRGFERLYKHGCHVKPGLIVDFLKTGWAGHVDLGQAVTNHVESNQQQTALKKNRANGFGDFSVTRAQRFQQTPGCDRQQHC